MEPHLSVNKYDDTVPSALCATQQWFAGLLLQPPIPQRNMRFQQEADTYISASPTLEAWQRLEIYNEQYWWRLLKTLQEACPLLTRLLGKERFNNQIAIPYLQKYPSCHWSINQLGQRLPQWIEEEYRAEKKDLILSCAQLDWAFNASTWAADLPALSIEQASEVFQQRLYLQPHLFLFRWNYDLLTLRKRLLQEEPNSCSKPTLPSIPVSNQFVVLYRDASHYIRLDKLSKSHFLALTQFRQGISIDNLCKWLDKQQREIYEEAAQRLNEWIQQWLHNQWLTASDS